MERFDVSNRQNKDENAINLTKKNLEYEAIFSFPDRIITRQGVLHLKLQITREIKIFNNEILWHIYCYIKVLCDILEHTVSYGHSTTSNFQILRYIKFIFIPLEG